MNLKAVLFDLGGTLLDLDYSKDFNEILRLGHQAMRNYFADEGLDIPLKKIVEVSHGIYEDYFSFASKSFIELDSSILYPAILYQLGIEDYSNKALIRGAIKSFQDPIINNYHIYGDAKGVLSELKEREFKLGLVSNNNSTYQFDCLVQKFDLAKYFDAKVVSSEVGIRKPHKGIFFHCLNLLKVNSKNSIFIGDRLRKDIQGAQNAGMKTVWINRTNETLTSESPKPHYEIKDLSELIDILL